MALLVNVGIRGSWLIWYNSLTSLADGRAVVRWCWFVKFCRHCWYWKVVGYRDGWNPFCRLEKGVYFTYCNFCLQICAPRDGSGDIKFKTQIKIMYEAIQVYEDTYRDTVQDIKTCMHTRLIYSREPTHKCMNTRWRYSTRLTHVNEHKFYVHYQFQPRVLLHW